MFTSRPNAELETLLLKIATDAKLQGPAPQYIERTRFAELAAAKGFGADDVDQALASLAHHRFLEEYGAGPGQSKPSAYCISERGFKKYLRENTSDYGAKIYAVAQAINRAGTTMTTNQRIQGEVEFEQEFVNHAFEELIVVRALKEIGPRSNRGGLNIKVMATPGLAEYLREHDPTSQG